MECIKFFKRKGLDIRNSLQDDKEGNEWGIGLGWKYFLNYWFAIFFPFLSTSEIVLYKTLSENPLYSNYND